MSTRARALDERLGTLREVDKLLADGLSQNEAASHLGISAGTISKWRAALTAGGLEALQPKTGRLGRPVKVPLNHGERAALRWHRLRKGSLTAAIVAWLSSKGGPEAVAPRPEIAALLEAELKAAIEERREYRWPQKLRQYAETTEQERDMFRGPKRAQQSEDFGRRGMYWLLNGQSVPVGGGDLYVSDDMSLNQPFRAQQSDGSWLVNQRQCLLTLDVASAGFLTAQPVARPGDAYRAEDVADHFLWTVLQWGLPLCWRLEMGTWASNFVKGLLLPPELLKANAGRVRWGGLGSEDGRTGLFRLQFVEKARLKEIEGHFKHLQQIEQHERGIDIGRTRGEMEAATAHMRRAKDGNEQARAAIPLINQRADWLAEACEKFNSEHKARYFANGAMLIPNELLPAEQARPLSPEDAWMFHPVKRLLTVRGGCVECRVDHYDEPFRFAVNGILPGLSLTGGHRVFIAFHPGRPEAGAMVCNAEPSRTTKNRDGWMFGQKLLTAAYDPMRPQWVEGALTPDLAAAAARSKAGKAEVTTSFRVMVKAGTGKSQRRAVSLDSRRDGRGNVQEVARGAAAPLAIHPAPEAIVSPAPVRAAAVAPIAARPPGQPSADALPSRRVRPVLDPESAALALLQ